MAGQLGKLGLGDEDTALAAYLANGRRGLSQPGDGRPREQARPFATAGLAAAPLGRITGGSVNLCVDSSRLLRGALDDDSGVLEHALEARVMAEVGRDGSGCRAAAGGFPGAG